MQSLTDSWPWADRLTLVVVVMAIVFGSVTIADRLKRIIDLLEQILRRL